MFALRMVAPAGTVLAFNALVWSTLGTRASLAEAAESAPPAPSAETATLEQSAAAVEEIIVTGRARQLYRVDETAVGKVPADRLDIPQSVQIISRQIIEDQGAREATDLYRNIGGVTFFSYAGVTFRGFRQEEIYYDGLRGDPYIGFSVPQLFNVERVEVLKGPAGMLYGPGAPGGLINYVTKTPGDSFAATAAAVAGNHDRWGASGEATGPLGDGTAVRAGAFFERQEPFRANTRDKTFLLDGGLSHRFGDANEVLLSTGVIDKKLRANRLRGVPVDNAGNFLTDIRWNHNEPTDFLNLESKYVQGRVESALSSALTVDATVRYIDSNEAQQYHEPLGLIDADRDGRIDTTRREFRDQERGTRTWSAGANAVVRTDLGGMAHTWLTGADWTRQVEDFRGRTATTVARGGPVPDLSLFDPVYGRTSAADYGLGAIAFRVTETLARRWGVYLQDQAQVTDTVQLLAGVRFDRFSDVDRVANRRFSDEDVTFRVGAIYQPRTDVSLYANYSEGFEPQSVANQTPLAGGPFAPQASRQVEAGMKTALDDGRIQASAAVYQIVRRNLLQTDPAGDISDGVNDLIALGKVRSRGFEVETVTDLTDDWVLTANYAYNDTKTVRSTGANLGNAVGTRFANAPRHQAGLWTRHQFAA
ncbi:MAG: TonB-dependent siderophore receptor, partial [Rhodospirillaceae bacterium]|nr:TonB-dependent siderophore receptor [Rhodospirillaceae bacterium]